jgi:hypothetical protein
VRRCSFDGCPTSDGIRSYPPPPAHSDSHWLTLTFASFSTVHWNGFLVIVVAMNVVSLVLDASRSELTTQHSFQRTPRLVACGGASSVTPEAGRVLNISDSLVTWTGKHFRSQNSSMHFHYLSIYWKFQILFTFYMSGKHFSLICSLFWPKTCNYSSLNTISVDCHTYCGVNSTNSI